MQAFVYELLGTLYYYKYRIQVKFEPITAQWSISDKSYDRGNVKASSVYGTARMNAYNIIEETLNLKDVRVVDYVEDENGNKKPVLNKKETTIARANRMNRRAFEEWIWKTRNARGFVRLYMTSSIPFFHVSIPESISSSTVCAGNNPAKASG